MRAGHFSYSISLLHKALRLDLRLINVTYRSASAVGLMGINGGLWNGSAVPSVSQRAMEGAGIPKSKLAVGLS